MSNGFDAFWEELRRRYAGLVLERLAIGGRLGAVAGHALAGGKRLRPLLAEALGEAAGAPPSVVTRVALAVEYLHAASLLLDDLPAMDRAPERRGTAAAHARFSEADAMLAAVALVARGYAVILDVGEGEAAAARRMALLVCEAIGGGGMAGGQAMELALPPSAGLAEVEAIHERKTAALFVLIARLLAAAVGADAETAARLAAFAGRFGRAYQAVDDIEDRDVPSEQRGNLACVLGADEARTYARELLRAARAAAADLGPSAVRLAQCTAWLEGRLDALS